jgi:hypothetical protein
MLIFRKLKNFLIIIKRAYPHMFLELGTEFGREDIISSALYFKACLSDAGAS